MNRKHVVACVAGAFLIAASAPAIDWNDPHSVVAAALGASPALRAIDAEVAAARARLKAAGALPNPMLMTGVQNQQIDLSTDPMMTMYMVGASQTLVRKERRQALQRAGTLDVRRLERQADSQRAEITRDALVAWNEAAAAESQIAASQEIVKIGGTMGEAARTRYEAGSAPQIDIIRAKLDESNVRHDLLMQQGLREQALARLRAMLNLDAHAKIPSFSLQHRLEHAHASDVSLNATTPAIAAVEAELARAEEDVILARLAAKPDLTVEATYGFRPQQKDVFSVAGRIELPIRRATAIEPRIAESIARRDAARAQIDLLRQQLRRDLGVAVAQRNEAVEQISLHVERLVPEAKLGFESALASYQTGKTTFDSVLGALHTYRMLNVDYYGFLRQLVISEAEIDAIQHGAIPAGGGR